MAKDQHNPTVDRFGGPGSSHQDHAHPGKNNQPTGHQGGGDSGASPPGTPTNPRESRVSGGGGERDSHHTHTAARA